MIISREPSSLSHAVDLVDISFQTLRSLHDSVLALQTEDRRGLPSIPLEAISRCFTVSRGLLSHFCAFFHTRISHSWMVLRLEPQLPIVYLFMNHAFLSSWIGIRHASSPRRLLSNFFKKDPLTEMTLDGTMVGGFTLKHVFEKSLV